jgi:hypothetical protein
MVERCGDGLPVVDATPASRHSLGYLAEPPLLVLAPTR